MNRRQRKYKLRQNCWKCSKFWKRKGRALCDLFRLPFYYDQEDLLLRKRELQERIKNINRKLKILEKENKPEDLEFGGQA